MPDGATPVFRYYAYDVAAVPTASLALPGPVATADLGRIARVSISYVARAGSGNGAGARPRRRHVHRRRVLPRRRPERSSSLPDMRMNLHTRIRSRLADESGFSMLAVMIVMIATTTFVVGGFAAANGDLPMSRNSQDRKATYAAAESGLNFYQYHLNSDNDYWTKCTNVAKPNASENSPVNQKWATRDRDRPAQVAQRRRLRGAVHARAAARHGLHARASRATRRR